MFTDEALLTLLFCFTDLLETLTILVAEIW